MAQNLTDYAIQIVVVTFSENLLQQAPKAIDDEKYGEDYDFRWIAKFLKMVMLDDDEGWMMVVDF